MGRKAYKLLDQPEKLQALSMDYMLMVMQAFITQKQRNNAEYARRFIWEEFGVGGNTLSKIKNFLDWPIRMYELVFNEEKLSYNQALLLSLNAKKYLALVDDPNLTFEGYLDQAFVLIQDFPDKLSSKDLAEVQNRIETIFDIEGERSKTQRALLKRSASPEPDLSLDNTFDFLDKLGDQGKTKARLLADKYNIPGDTQLYTTSHREHLGIEGDIIVILPRDHPSYEEQYSILMPRVKNETQEAEVIIVILREYSPVYFSKITVNRLTPVESYHY